MGNIIGEPLKQYVTNQIKARQTLHGSGAGPNSSPRNDNQINLLNSSTAWIKLASAVQIKDKKRLNEIGVDDSLTELLLAKKFILSSGLSEFDDIKLINRGGFDPLSVAINSSYTYGSYGYVPMPGLISADIKTLNRGSIKKATVKLIAQDTQQLQIIDLLYLRLGYTVLLEWGNSLYTKTGTDKNILRQTILEKDFYTNKNFRKVIDKIEEERKIHEGNYDGFLAKVSNFSWSVNNDGSYDIELTLISLGDVVESLKTNISPDSNTVNFLSQSKTTTVASLTSGVKKDEDTESPTENNQASSIIHSMLYIWKWLDEANLKIRQPSYPELVNIFGSTSKTYGYNISNKLSSSTSPSTISFNFKTYVFLFHGEIRIGFDYNGGGVKFLPDDNWKRIDFEYKGVKKFYFPDENRSWVEPIIADGVDFGYLPLYKIFKVDYSQDLNDPPLGAGVTGEGFYRGGINLSRFSYERIQIPDLEDTEENKIALFEQKIFDWGKSYFKSVQGDGYLSTLGGPVSEDGTGRKVYSQTYFPDKQIFNAKSGSTEETANYFFQNGFYAGWNGNSSYKNIYTGLYTEYPDKSRGILTNTFTKEFAGTDYDPNTKDAAVDGIIYNKDRIGKKEILDRYIREDVGVSGTVTLSNPLINAKINDAVKITSVVPHYYLRLGFLLEYIKNNVIPKIVSPNSKNPMIDIQYNDDDIMFSIEDQISLDPRICIVRNDDFLLGDKIYQQACLPFRVTDDLASLGSTKVDKDFAGYVMNIYLNFDFIIESLAEDERGDVNLFDFLKNICTGINKALGGINNLEPVLDEDTNIVRIIDTTPIPGTVRDDQSPSTEETIILTGYKNTSTNYISNFVRKVNLKTAITPAFATMITVGATAGGYVKGTDATAFSKWNKGLVDLYKEEVEPGNEETAKQAKSGSIDEAITNWEKKIANAPQDERLGFSNVTNDEGLLGIDLKDSIIQGNVSIGTEYYKYYVAKESNTEGGTAGGGSIGFIPFKLSFTMDGLSGIKIYNKLNVDTSFLPSTYGNNLDLIVTGVSHRLQNQDWETSIETTVIPKSKPTKSTKRFTGGVVSRGPQPHHLPEVEELPQ
jgi:hypothetical protein